MSALINAKLYTPLQKWQTRVLRLHPAQHADEPLEADLLRAGLADGPYLLLSMDEPLIQFEATSYTWGKPGPVQHEIICDGLIVSILPSLNAALRRFRRTDSARYLWADAICINQSDDSEKSAQVANMFTIFHKAQRVLAWLGEEGTDTGQALAYLRSSDIHGTGADDDKIEPDLREFFEGLTIELQDALKDLLYLPWCRRVWIQQEIFAARELKLFCGTQELTLSEYRSIANRLLKETSVDPSAQNASDSSRVSEEVLKAVSTLSMASESTLAGLTQSRSSYQNLDGRFEMFSKTRRGSSSIEQTLLRSRTLHASNPRDYVYALLNLTDCPIITEKDEALHKDGILDNPLGVTIDYSRSFSEILQDVTRFIMNVDCSIAVLESYEPRGDSADDAYCVPSWTIDWRNQAPASEYQDTQLYPRSTDYHYNRVAEWAV